MFYRCIFALDGMLLKAKVRMAFNNSQSAILTLVKLKSGAWKRWKSWVEQHQFGFVVAPLAALQSNLAAELTV
jgi:hypothetical protein